jgi:hypothetical protein
MICEVIFEVPLSSKTSHPPCISICTSYSSPDARFQSESSALTKCVDIFQPVSTSVVEIFTSKTEAD